MDSESKSKMNMAKAWCFDNSVTEEQVIQAWDNALKARNFIIKNLNSHGYKWWWLPEHLLKQLIERYSETGDSNGQD